MDQDQVQDQDQAQAHSRAPAKVNIHLPVFFSVFVSSDVVLFKLIQCTYDRSDATLDIQSALEVSITQESNVFFFSSGRRSA